MNEPSEEVKAMARRIASQFAETSENIDYEVHIAIATILETQRRDAELANSWLQSNFDESANCMAQNIRDEILSGTHYGKAEQ